MTQDLIRALGRFEVRVIACELDELSDAEFVWHQFSISTALSARRRQKKPGARPGKLGITSTNPEYRTVPRAAIVRLGQAVVVHKIHALA